MEASSTKPETPEETFRLYEANCREFEHEIRQYKQRIKKLVAFQPNITEDALSKPVEASTSPQETSMSPQTLPDEVDTFSHFLQNCPNRTNSKRHVAFFEPVHKCTQCYDHSSTRALEYWDPIKHKDYLKTFPDKVKKETRDRENVRSRPANAQGVRQRYGVDATTNDEFVMSDESMGEDEMEEKQDRLGKTNEEIGADIEVEIESEDEDVTETNTEVVDDNEMEHSRGNLLPQAELEIFHPQPRRSPASIVIPDSSSDRHLPPLPMTRPQLPRDRVVIEISSDEDEEMNEAPERYSSASINRQAGSC